MFTQQELDEAMKQFPEVQDEAFEYRLHYDNSGHVYLQTQQNHPEDTQYIVVDETVYFDNNDYKIVDGKPKIIDLPTGYRVQLKSSNKGYCVIKNHAGILLEKETYNNVEFYEDNS
jgi:hypothetical protein